MRGGGNSIRSGDDFSTMQRALNVASVESALWSPSDGRTRNNPSGTKAGFRATCSAIKFGQSLILRQHIPFQMGDSFLFGLMVGSSSQLKNCGSVLLNCQRLF